MSQDTYQLWAEIWDATYTNKLGVGPILLQNANATQARNGPGTAGISTQPLHPDFTIRAMDLLSSKAVVEIWTQTPGHDKRLVSSFVVDSLAYSRQTGGLTLQADGPTTLDLLNNASTLIAREYNNTTDSAVLSALTALAGWTKFSDGVSSTVGLSVRFDGASVLKSIQFIAEQGGYRMRESTTTKKQLIIGNNENFSAVRIGFAQGDKPAVRFNDDVIVADNIEIADDSNDVVNWIIPVGAGDGDATQTLEDSTRTSPYTIETMVGPDGRTLYYMSDATSITSYGQIERKLNFKQIAPLGTSLTSSVNAANLLYDAASQWLTQFKDPQQVLVISTRNLQTPLYIGDKIYVQYVETVNYEGKPYTLQSIEGYYWIIATNESVGTTGSTVRLTVSNIDRVVRGSAQIIVGGLDSIEVNGIAFKPIFNIWTMGPYQDYANFGNAAINYEMNIPDDVLLVTNVTLLVSTLENRSISIAGDPVLIRPSDPNPNTGDFPTLDISVNATSVASAIGSSTVALSNFEIDVTDEIIGAGDDGRGKHNIEVDIDSTRGGYNIQVLIRGIITTGKV